MPSITLSSHSISYTLRQSSRSRRLRLTVYADGAIILTSPPGASAQLAENFIRAKEQWLISKLEFFADRAKRNRAKQPGAAPAFKLPRLTRRDYLRYKPEALALVERKVAELNATPGYGHCYNRISVKNQKTCWGSCSRKGNLNFNVRILFVPERAQNYIVAHELCHLAEFNHSRRFWDLVARISPDYKEIRRELKQAGLRGGLY